MTLCPTEASEGSPASSLLSGLQTSPSLWGTDPQIMCPSPLLFLISTHLCAPSHHHTLTYILILTHTFTHTHTHQSGLCNMSACSPQNNTLHMPAQGPFIPRTVSKLRSQDSTQVCGSKSSAVPAKALSSPCSAWLISGLSFRPSNSLSNPAQSRHLSLTLQLSSGILSSRKAPRSPFPDCVRSTAPFPLNFWGSPCVTSTAQAQ